MGNVKALAPILESYYHRIRISLFWGAETRRCLFYPGDPDALLAAWRLCMNG